MNGGDAIARHGRLRHRLGLAARLKVRNAGMMSIRRRVTGCFAT